mmetsp:Transcript_36586/g.108907  ORF Transcript_36586/g.108907 Transcript_36586/m.108907 type:complete len:244 (-) Transcript_36586:726-1457(-)
MPRDEPDGARLRADPSDAGQEQGRRRPRLDGVCERRGAAAVRGDRLRARGGELPPLRRVAAAGGPRLRPRAAGLQRGDHAARAHARVRALLQADRPAEGRGGGPRPEAARQEDGGRLPHPGPLDRLLPLRPSPGQPVRGRGRQAGLLRLRHDERASAQRLPRLQGGVRRRLRRRALHLRAAARNEREEARGRSRADGGARKVGGPAGGGEARSLLHPHLQADPAGQGGVQYQDDARRRPAGAD